MTGTHDLHTLTGAYAVDALDAEETRAFEEHLAGCESCAEEVQGLRAAAARMGAAERVEPSAAFRAEVMAKVGRTRQVPPVVDLASRAAARRRRTTWFAAAAALVVLAGGLGGLSWREHDVAVQARQQASAVSQVMGAPDVRTAKAAGTRGGEGTVMWSAGLDRAVFVTRGLPALPGGRSYQLWIIDASGPRPEPVLRGGAQGATAPVVMDGLAGARSMAVTVEPDGGSLHPTTSPVLVVPVT